MIPTATGQERSLGKQRFSDVIVAEANRACVDSGNTQGKPRGIAEAPASASGGHIDLWNESRLTNNGLTGTLETFARFTLGINNPWIPVYSDLRNSKLILFFEVK